MKFIGQYIQRFIARFKSDVYLDDIDSGTIASGGNLGLDSDNKIVKATISSGSGDITAVTITTDSGGGSAASDTGGSADFSILGSSGVGVTNSGTTITAVSVPGEIDHDSLNNFVAAEHYDWASDNSSTATIHTQNINDLHGAGVDGNDDQLLTDGGDGTISSEGNLTYDGYDLTAISSLEGKPVLTLKTTHSTKTKSAELQFLKDAADTEDGENLGLITFYGEDEGNNNTKFGHIKGSIQESDEGQEGGSIKLAVATHDGEIVNGLVINDGSSEDEIDVTIGSSAASVTTVAGTLTMGSTATINNEGVIQVAAQTVIDHDQLANFAANEHYTQNQITTVGTIGTGIWRGSSISTTYTDAKVTSIVAGDGIDVSGATGDVTVTAETATDSNPGVVELATDAEAVTATDTAKAVTPANLKARVSQIANIKGYVTLQNDIYDYANPYVTDDEAPFQLDKSYGSGTIDSSTEQTQSSFFRSNGFHVPFACTVSALQVQASVNGSGGGNIVAALVEYRPSTASGDTNDYPRTVYEEVTVASNNNNSKVATTTIAAADLDATVVPAGSHLVLMVKGDSTTAGDLAVVSMSIGLSW
tara:strand:+ start:336 stop:2105 length:1770 start_codon:yes stop_codon:yes gene_type:complete